MCLDMLQPQCFSIFVILLFSVTVVGMLAHATLVLVIMVCLHPSSFLIRVVEIGVTRDSDTIVCFHPAPEFPYELTQVGIMHKGCMDWFI